MALQDAIDTNMNPSDMGVVENKDKNATLIIDDLNHKLYPGTKSQYVQHYYMKDGTYPKSADSNYRIENLEPNKLPEALKGTKANNLTLESRYVNYLGLTRPRAIPVKWDPDKSEYVEDK